MTNADVKGLIDAMNGLTSANLGLSPKMWFTLTKNRKALLEADKITDDARIELVKKHSTGEGDVPKVSEDKIDIFQKEFFDLLSINTTVELTEIPLKDIEKDLQKISGVNNIYLFFEHMISDDESVPAKKSKSKS